MMTSASCRSVWEFHLKRFNKSVVESIQENLPSLSPVFYKAQFSLVDFYFVDMNV